jgi:hypothetical protein
MIPEKGISYWRIGNSCEHQGKKSKTQDGFYRRGGKKQLIDRRPGRKRQNMNFCQCIHSPKTRKGEKLEATRPKTMTKRREDPNSL